MAQKCSGGSIKRHTKFKVHKGTMVHVAGRWIREQRQS